MRWIDREFGKPSFENSAKGACPIRNAVIMQVPRRATSGGALTGTWDETVSRSGWSYTKTPYFVAIYGTFEAGTYTLPFSFGDNVVLAIAYADGHQREPRAQGDGRVSRCRSECMMQAVAFGLAAQTRPVIG